MLKYLFIFSMFSTLGWLLELTYKSITNKEIINPGILTGCSVVIYGFGTVLLDIICNILSNIKSNYRLILILIVSTILLTLLELIAGKILIKKFNVVSWDYSNQKFNYKGIICLKFSFIWFILAGLFYYFIFPWIDSFSTNIIINNINLFLLGIYYGIFIIDVFVSLNILNKLSKYSRKKNIIINIEKLKKELSNSSKIIDKIYPYNNINKFLKEKSKRL